MSSDYKQVSTPDTLPPRPPPLGHVPPPPPSLTGLPPVPPPLGVLPPAPPPMGVLPPPPPTLHHQAPPAREHSPSPSPPPQPKPSILSKPLNNRNFGIKMSLGGGSPVVKPQKSAPKSVSAVFNNESSDEDEEIPHEARYNLYFAPLSWSLTLMVRIIAE